MVRKVEIKGRERVTIREDLWFGFLLEWEASSLWGLVGSISREGRIKRGGWVCISPGGAAGMWREVSGIKGDGKVK